MVSAVGAKDAGGKRRQRSPGAEFIGRFLSRILPTGIKRTQAVAQLLGLMLLPTPACPVTEGCRDGVGGKRTDQMMRSDVSGWVCTPTQKKVPRKNEITT